jgi:chemotaxis signal transduction protein
MERVLVHAGERVLAIDTTHVRELATLGSFTPVPGASDDVVGVMQLRGRLVTIVRPYANALMPRAGTPLLIVECVVGGATAVLGLIIEGLADAAANAEDFDVARLADALWREHGARA